MIENNKQLEITRKALKRFKDDLKDFGEVVHVHNVHPRLIALQKDAMASEIEVLQKQIDEYVVKKLYEEGIRPT